MKAGTQGNGETGPLTGVRVLDFSTLLPGPLATLMLAQAGADVLKIERPPEGDEMRRMGPVVDGQAVWYEMLNRGKRSLMLDLKTADARAALDRLVRLAHVLVEQFRPGVMARLGLGPDEVRAVNPDLVYCSIGGFSPHGPKAGMAGHDLMYLADSGLLSLVADGDGRPTMPHALIADIAAGAYPAVINILLGLLSRPRGGRFHVTMADNVSPFLFWAVAAGRSGAWPRPGAELFTGGSPRYQIYETADGRFLAAAPLEPRFWQAFCDAIGLDPLLRDDRVDPKATRDAVAALVRRRSADQWMREFSGRDACCTVVRTVEEASGALAAGVVGAPPEASTPLDPAFLAGVLPRAPALGEANAGMESLWTD